MIVVCLDHPASSALSCWRGGRSRAGGKRSWTRITAYLSPTMASLPTATPNAWYTTPLYHRRSAAINADRPAHGMFAPFLRPARADTH